MYDFNEALAKRLFQFPFLKEINENAFQAFVMRPSIAFSRRTKNVSLVGIPSSVTITTLLGCRARYTWSILENDKAYQLEIIE